MLKRGEFRGNNMNDRQITISLCAKVAELLDYVMEQEMLTESEVIEDALTQYFTDEWKAVNRKKAD